MLPSAALGTLTQIIPATGQILRLPLLDESLNSILITVPNQTISIRYNVSQIADLLAWQLLIAFTHSAFVNITIPANNIFAEATLKGDLFPVPPILKSGSVMVGCVALGAQYVAAGQGVLCDLHFTLTGDIGTRASFLIDTSRQATMLVNSNAKTIPYSCHEDDRVG